MILKTICAALLLMLLPCMLSSQNSGLKIAIISDIDTSMTHLYEAKTKYDDKISRYPFNLNAYIKGEFERVIDTLNLLFRKNYSIKNYPLPGDYKKNVGLLNFFNKPNKSTKKYVEELAEKEGIHYAIVISYSPLSAETENDHINPHDYGVCSYQNYDRILTYFTLIDFFLFQTEPPELIYFDYPTDLAKDVKYFDFLLKEDLSKEEKQELPKEHIEFAIEMIKEMAGIKVEKILRIILQRISQNP